MRRLSSTFTVFYKRVFPVVWLLVPAISGFALWNASMHGRAPAGWLPLLPPVVIFVVGLAIHRKLIFDLVDEVWLDGDQLVIKDRGQQTRIALADVINVNATIMINPRRVTLMLRSDSRFGRTITFIPASPRGFGAAFKPDPIATDLIGRIDALRQARR
ncbi:hypothetical protein [Rhodanobacter sp. BL-MT-08]